MGKIVGRLVLAIRQEILANDGKGMGICSTGAMVCLAIKRVGPAGCSLRSFIRPAGLDYGVVGSLSLDFGVKLLG